jgi:para-aminobenzoate synthetase component 1
MKTIDFNLEHLEAVKMRLYHFANQFDVCHVYDSNQKSSACAEDIYEFLLGLGSKRKYNGNLSDQLKEAEGSEFWKFLAIPYNKVEEIDHALVFEPLLVFSILKNSHTLRIINNGIDEQSFRDWVSAFENYTYEPNVIKLTADFQTITSKDLYVKQVEQIRKDIYNGVFYEMNYCIEFKASMHADNLLPCFLELNSLTQAPFAAYVKHSEMTMLCSSPERFIKREGQHLLSQPIKGTNARLHSEENIRQLNALSTSVKERAENVMIVDLVRNDMAKISKAGTVKVKELCGAYAYKSVNHLVSTIKSELNDGTNCFDAFQALFPMGSMTGAPKLEVMKHILDYECQERGFYSGCIGYMDPNGDFDFNVCIRTLIYQADNKEISYNVGSAITYDSSPVQEYEECMIKGSRMLSVFKKD